MMNKKKINIINKEQASVNGFTFQKILNYSFLACFIYCLWLALGYIFIGFDNMLLENHSFRQTQTALTSYYFIKDGYKLAYETPVVGYPWAIPFEFPLYQAICSFLKSHSSISLDKAGRVVSLLFYALSLLMVFLISKRYTKNKFESAFILVFILLHPIYIFWSRTFMIESTVLFFSLLYLYFALIAIEKPNNYIITLLACFSGTLAGLVKITTLIPIFIFLFLLVFRQWYVVDQKKIDLKQIIKYSVYGIALFLIPFFISKLWVDYADQLKELNTYAARFTVSKYLNEWNFGTLEQKISSDTWSNIFAQSQISSNAFYVIILILAIVVYFLNLKYKIQVLVCLGLYLVAPLIFTNLHYVHDYYTYSNSLFLSVSIGFIILSFFHHTNRLLISVSIIFTFGTLIFFNKRYQNNYLKVQKSHPDYIKSIASLVKEHTKSDDVIMVYGNEWGSEYAYYCERKTIALKNDCFVSIKDSSFLNLIKLNEKLNISALVFVTYTGAFKNEFANELINYLGFKPILQQEPFFVFIKDLKK